jgi:hypothetical protein
MLVLIASMGLVTSADAQVVISPHDPTDRILLHHQAAVAWAREHRTGILPYEATQPLPRGFDMQLAPRARGAALWVNGPEGALLLAPSEAVEHALSIRILLPNGDWATVRGVMMHPDIPIAGLVCTDLPEDLIPLEVAAPSEATEGRRALHLSGLDIPAAPALNRAHLIRRALPPLARYWATDVRVPDGHPLLTPEGRLLAIAFRKMNALSTESLAAGPEVLTELLQDLSGIAPQLLGEVPTKRVAPARHRP